LQDLSNLDLGRRQSIDCKLEKGSKKFAEGGIKIDFITHLVSMKHFIFNHFILLYLLCMTVQCSHKTTADTRATTASAPEGVDRFFTTSDGVRLHYRVTGQRHQCARKELYRVLP
jgi:hypothetical protein